MSEAGFFAQKRNSPTGFILVVAGHVAALGALALAKTPVFILPDSGPIIVESIPIPPEPRPVEQPPRPQEPSRMTVAPIPTPVPFDDILIFDPPRPPVSDPRPPGPVFAEAGPPVVPTPTVRRAAELLSGDLQPPYPAIEERAQRGGIVRLRLTIGTDGRVIAVERLQATSDAFWRATEQQARTRWRFRPATEDGRPIVGTRVMTVTFRIEDIRA